MHIISIVNRKGGVGKTTTSVNLAAIWASKGLRTLLIDIDTQGHAAHGVNFETSKKNTGSHQIFVNSSEQLENHIFKTQTPDLHFIPATENFDGKVNHWETNCLSRHLSQPAFLLNYDLIVIDTPPTLSEILINAINATDLFLIPFVPHHLASVGVEQLFNTMEKYININQRQYALIPVMMDTRTKLHKAIISKLKDKHGQNHLLHGIKPNIKLAEAFEKKTHIMKYAPKSPGAYDYTLLAEDIMALWPPYFSQHKIIGQPDLFPAIDIKNKIQPAQSKPRRGIQLKNNQ